MTTRRKSISSKSKKGQVQLESEELLSLQQECLTRLEETRKEIAQSNFVTNPEYVFTSLTLEQLSTKMPTTEEEMMNVDGVTFTKFSQFGQDFLAVSIPQVIFKGSCATYGLCNHLTH